MAQGVLAPTATWSALSHRIDSEYMAASAAMSRQTTGLYATEGIISGALEAIKSFMASVWEVVRGLKDLVLGKSKKETDRISEGEKKLEGVSDEDLNAALDKPLPENMAIPRQRSVVTEATAAVASSVALAPVYGLLPLSKKMALAHWEHVKEAGRIFNSQFQECTIDNSKHTLVIKQKGGEALAKVGEKIKTLRAGGWTRENIKNVFNSLRKAASPSRWGSIIKQAFKAIPAVFRTILGALREGSGSKAIVGFFKSWLHLFKQLVWAGTFGKIIFCATTAMTVVGVISKSKSKESQ